MEEIKNRLREFNEARDWEKFHTPENLAKSIAIEAGELLECYQWGETHDKKKVSDEIADVMSYCIMLADRLELDIKSEILRKIKKNGEKYPVEKCRGISKKYHEL